VFRLKVSSYSITSGFLQRSDIGSASVHQIVSSTWPALPTACVEVPRFRDLVLLELGQLLRSLGVIR